MLYTGIEINTLIKLNSSISFQKQCCDYDHRTVVKLFSTGALHSVEVRIWCMSLSFLLCKNSNKYRTNISVNAFLSVRAHSTLSFKQVSSVRCIQLEQIKHCQRNRAYGTDLKWRKCKNCSLVLSQDEVRARKSSQGTYKALQSYLSH